MPVDDSRYVALESPFDSPHYTASPSYFPVQYAPRPPVETPWPRGTVLHKGFYDLLAVIPTPSPSAFWRTKQPESNQLVAGPRYEQLPQDTQSPPRKPRKISKDMVSKPTGFVCVQLAF